MRRENGSLLIVQGLIVQGCFVLPVLSSFVILPPQRSQCMGLGIIRAALVPLERGSFRYKVFGTNIEMSVCSTRRRDTHRVRRCVSFFLVGVRSLRVTQNELHRKKSLLLLVVLCLECRYVEAAVGIPTVPFCLKLEARYSGIAFNFPIVSHVVRSPPPSVFAY